MRHTSKSDYDRVNRCSGASRSELRVEALQTHSAEELEHMERNWLWLLRLLHLEKRGHESAISSVSGVTYTVCWAKARTPGKRGGKLTPALMCSHHVCDHPAAVWSTKPPCCLGNRPVQTLVVRTRLFRISLLYRWWVVLLLFFHLSLSLWVALVLKHIVPIRIDS